MSYVWLWLTMFDYVWPEWTSSIQQHPDYKFIICELEVEDCAIYHAVSIDCQALESVMESRNRETEYHYVLTRLEPFKKCLNRHEKCRPRDFDALVSAWSPIHFLTPSLTTSVPDCCQRYVQRAYSCKSESYRWSSAWRWTAELCWGSSTAVRVLCPDFERRTAPPM